MPELDVMTSKVNVLRLTDFVRGLSGFEVRARTGPCYAHMGATICDAILQAGLNYRTVVAPRVERVMRRWPSATVTSRFLAMVTRYGVDDVLLWNHPEKPARIRQLAKFFSVCGLETEHDLARWFVDEPNGGDKLRELKGIGPKTVDYLKSLVGVPAVAVDRHVRTFVAWAGIDASDYAEVRELVCAVADALQLERHALDHAIWSFVAASGRQRRRRAA